MTLKHLEIFRAVCREKTMTNAATILHMTQPAVSRAIAEMENHYKKRLFNRIGKRLSLTDDGEQLLTDAENVLKAYETLEVNIGLTKPSALLKVGCSLGIGFGYMEEYLQAFEEVCPMTKVHVMENPTSVLQTYLLSGELDFAIVEGYITDPSLVTTPFFDDELVLLAPPSYPLADGHCVKAKELPEHDLLLLDRMTATRGIFDNVMASHGIHVSPIWTGINPSVLLRMAREGKGITVVSRHWAEKDLADGTLVVLPAEFSMHRTYSLVYHRSKYLPPEAFTFMELCKKITK